MKERPILFTGPMVRAILDGSKTQTRRIAKEFAGRDDLDGILKRFPNQNGCPHGQPGDRLWVRETHQYYGWTDDGAPQMRFEADGSKTWPQVPVEKAAQVEEIWADLSLPGNYDIDNHARDRKWRPSIHMSRWASRILLEIVSVRVERLQDIGEADARAEGVTIEDQHMRGYCAGEFLPPSIRAYRDLWESINGAGSWDANPWVWVVEFKRVAP